jgi:hypothetical protein
MAFQCQLADNNPSSVSSVLLDPFKTYIYVYLYLCNTFAIYKSSYKYSLAVNASECCITIVEPQGLTDFGRRRIGLSDDSMESDLSGNFGLSADGQPLARFTSNNYLFGWGSFELPAHAASTAEHASASSDSDGFVVVEKPRFSSSYSRHQLVDTTGFEKSGSPGGRSEHVALFGAEPSELSGTGKRSHLSFFAQFKQQPQFIVGVPGVMSEVKEPLPSDASPSDTLDKIEEIKEHVPKAILRLRSLSFPSPGLQSSSLLSTSSRSRSLNDFDAKPSIELQPESQKTGAEPEDFLAELEKSEKIAEEIRSIGEVALGATSRHELGGASDSTLQEPQRPDYEYATQARQRNVAANFQKYFRESRKISEPSIPAQDVGIKSSESAWRQVLQQTPSSIEGHNVATIGRELPSASDSGPRASTSESNKDPNPNQDTSRMPYPVVMDITTDVLRIPVSEGTRPFTQSRMPPKYVPTPRVAPKTVDSESRAAAISFKKGISYLFDLAKKFFSGKT